MSAKAIREATGKELINKYLEGGDALGVAKSRFASVTETTDWAQLLADNPWLETTVSVDLSVSFVWLPCHTFVTRLIV